MWTLDTLDVLHYLQYVHGQEDEKPVFWLYLNTQYLFSGIFSQNVFQVIDYLFSGYFILIVHEIRNFTPLLTAVEVNGLQAKLYPRRSLALGRRAFLPPGMGRGEWGHLGEVSQPGAWTLQYSSFLHPSQVLHKQRRALLLLLVRRRKSGDTWTHSGPSWTCCQPPPSWSSSLRGTRKLLPPTAQGFNLLSSMISLLVFLYIVRQPLRILKYFYNRPFPLISVMYFAFPLARGGGSINNGNEAHLIVFGCACRWNLG